jgi:hypothetical protein
MEILTRDDLRALVREHDGLCVSVYMPTHRVGREVQQDPIRLKNLLGKAQDRIVASGVRAPEARELLKPAEMLLHDGLFWQHQSDSLALFVSPEIFHHYRLPFDFAVGGF